MEGLPTNTELVLPLSTPFIATALCEVFYSGRASSKLPKGNYIIIVKADKSVAIHDCNFKPINYQASGSDILIDYIFNTIMVTKKKERLFIIIHQLLSVMSLESIDSGKLDLFGTERHMVNKFLSEIDQYFPNHTKISVEHTTTHGPIDVLVWLDDGSLVVIEAKRKTAGISAYSQVGRYRNWLESENSNRKIIPVILSPKITPSALEALEREGGRWIQYSIGQPTYRELLGDDYMSLFDAV